MKVKVRLFALAREIVGQSELTLILPAGATLGYFSEWLLTEYPKMAGLELRFAVNKAYKGLETILNASDEIACIPPVSGG
ncbi:MAG: MoaD/ThiS family protein [Anaerolineae bacterium]|nr:MoaD/ThiS family protein [Anaerolineae bacterium]